MRFTPQTEAELLSLKTPKDARRRMRSMVDTNEHIKKPWAIADINKMTDIDRMTLVACHVLFEVERLEKLIAERAGMPS